MPKIHKLDGSLSEEFVGFGFEDDVYYIGILGEWKNFTVYMPCGSYDDLAFAYEDYQDISRVRSCGLSPIVTHGCVEIDPEFD